MANGARDKATGHIPSPPEAARTDPIASMQPKIDALLDAGFGAERAHFEAALGLILTAWPDLPKASYRTQGPANAADDPSETSQTQAGMSPAPPTTADAPGRAPVAPRLRLWRILLAMLVQPEDPPATLDECVLRAATLIEPDPSARALALRHVAVRLGYPGGKGEPEPGTRRRAVAAIEAVVRRRSGQIGKARGTPSREEIAAGAEGARRSSDENPDASARTAPERAPAPGLAVTDCAGLVLLHPFLRKLFDRLDLLTPDAALVEGGVSRARGTLCALAGRSEPGPPDPLHLLLLGLSQNPDIPDAVMPAETETDLIDSLLRAVVTHWGRLGNTSPDGLRETFLRRTGTLRFEEEGALLRVAPGAFDMLLDGLPWAVSPVALPWMPKPCRVVWRDRDE